MSDLNEETNARKYAELEMERRRRLVLESSRATKVREDGNAEADDSSDDEESSITHISIEDLNRLREALSVTKSELAEANRSEKSLREAMDTQKQYLLHVMDKKDASPSRDVGMKKEEIKMLESRLNIAELQLSETKKRKLHGSGTSKNVSTPVAIKTPQSERTPKSVTSTSSSGRKRFRGLRKAVAAITGVHHLLDDKKDKRADTPMSSFETPSSKMDDAEARATPSPYDPTSEKKSLANDEEKFERERELKRQIAKLRAEADMSRDKLERFMNSERKRRQVLYQTHEDMMHMSQAKLLAELAASESTNKSLRRKLKYASQQNTALSPIVRASESRPCCRRCMRISFILALVLGIVFASLRACAGVFPENTLCNRGEAAMLSFSHTTGAHIVETLDYCKEAWNTSSAQAYANATSLYVAGISIDEALSNAREIVEIARAATINMGRKALERAVTLYRSYRNASDVETARNEDEDKDKDADDGDKKAREDGATSDLSDGEEREEGEGRAARSSSPKNLPIASTGIFRKIYDWIFRNIFFPVGMKRPEGD
eukprot:g173.t1